MRTLIWGKAFARAFRRTVKKHPDLREDIEKSLKLLAKDPFAPQLETHKLKGKLSGLWACSVGYDLRLLPLIPKPLKSRIAYRGSRVANRRM